MKALTAGKHVLLEKPSSNTAEETRTMFELAERRGLVLMEAVHYRYLPPPFIKVIRFLTLCDVDSTQQSNKPKRYSTAVS